MESSKEAAKQLTEFKRKTEKQFEELKQEIEELKATQAEILTRLDSAEFPAAREEERPAVHGKGHEHGFETYCAECLGMRPIVSPRRMRMADGSPAVQGECSACGTTLFRMTTMSGTITTEGVES